MQRRNEAGVTSIELVGTLLIAVLSVTSIYVHMQRPTQIAFQEAAYAIDGTPITELSLGGQTEGTANRGDADAGGDEGEGDEGRRR